MCVLEAGLHLEEACCEVAARGACVSEVLAPPMVPSNPTSGAEMPVVPSIIVTSRPCGQHASFVKLIELRGGRQFASQPKHRHFQADQKPRAQPCMSLSHTHALLPAQHRLPPTQPQTLSHHQLLMLTTTSATDAVASFRT